MKDNLRILLVDKELQPLKKYLEELEARIIKLEIEAIRVSYKLEQLGYIGNE